MDRIRFVWELLPAHGEAAHLGDSPRQELVDLVTGEPRRALDVGCHRGALGAALKQRFPGLHCTGIELNPVTAEAARELGVDAELAATLTRMRVRSAT